MSEQGTVASVDLAGDQGETSDIALLSAEHKIQDKCCKYACVQVTLIVFHVFNCLTNVVCLGFWATFDTLCAVKHGKSIVNCTEKVIIQKPQPLVMVFFLTTVTNAIVAMVTLYLKPTGVEFCGFKAALRQLIRKGSFWSMNITYVFVVLEYILIALPQSNLDVADKALSIMVVVFFAAKLVVAYCSNYVLPVRFPAVNERSFTRVYISLAYWITLVLFFLATAYTALAITLDVAEKISPLGKVQTGSRDFETVIHLVLLGIKATFEARLSVFFWNKLFHGDKDLFSTFIVLKSIQHLPIPRTGTIIPEGDFEAR